MREMLEMKAITKNDERILVGLLKSWRDKIACRDNSKRTHELVDCATFIIDEIEEASSDAVKD